MGAEALSGFFLFYFYITWFPLRLLFLFLMVVLDCLVQGLGTEIGAMKLLLGKTLELISNGAGRDFHYLFQALALGHFAYHAGDGNGRPTAEGLELNIFQVVVLDLDVKGHHVAADGISHFADAIGVFYFPYITGMHEVFHYLFTVDRHPICLLYSI
jgi:hypothetical protein